jgi:hypothetical protein
MGGERVLDVEFIFQLLDICLSVSKIFVSLIHLLLRISSRDDENAE